MDIDNLLKNLNIKKDDRNEKYGTVIEHTRMEELIFRDKKNKIDDLHKDIDYTISEIEESGSEKLSTFKYLSQDLFNMFYKLNPTNREEEVIEDNSARINKKIIEKVRENTDYSALKLITEGKDFESIEGAREFVKNLYDNLDELLEEITGDKGVINRLEKLEDALEKKEKELNSNLELHAESLDTNPGIAERVGKKISSIENQIKGIKREIDQYEDIIKANSYKNKDKIDIKINKALKKSLDKVSDIQDFLDSWGTEDGRPQSLEDKNDLVKKVKANKKFTEMGKLIGKMRKMAKAELNKSYSYGRGEKVGIEYGDKLNRVLPSELALLGTEETKALFYKKFVDKKLKQYEEREEIYKGRGHVIYMVDESHSTSGGKEYWAKALGIALMDIAIKDNRNFAFIPFNTTVGNIHHVNPQNYSQDICFQIANSFLGGGTNFTEPIKISIDLLEDDRYENADLVFVTDGQARIDAEVLAQFKQVKQKKKCKCVGILLDKGGRNSVSEYTIKQFCDVIYRTSEITEDKIAESVINKVI